MGSKCNFSPLKESWWSSVTFNLQLSRSRRTSVYKDKSAKNCSIRTIFFRTFVYKDNLKFCLKKFFFGRRPKIFDKSSIRCALSSVHDEIEKQALLQGKIYLFSLSLKLSQIRNCMMNCGNFVKSKINLILNKNGPNFVKP